MNDIEREISAAREGRREALGGVLESCRAYLLLVADRELEPGLAAKVGASDMVQEALLGAQRDFGEFRGRGEDDLRRWLRGILVHALANARRGYRRTEKRRLGREVPVEVGGAREPADEAGTPSADLIRGERERALREAIGRLPEDYRRVVAWRHVDRLPFDEIGRRLGGAGEAARKLWSRALARLRKELGPVHDPR